MSEAAQRYAEAVLRGELGYTDPASGLWVMTALAHRQRGHCCGSGCRHCPWVDSRNDAALPAKRDRAADTADQ